MTVALGLACAGALPTADAATWSSSLSLSTPGILTTYEPSIAIADGGNGIETWAEPADGKSVVRVAVHGFGTAWTPLAGTVSGGVPGDGCTPAGSIDSAGNALVVWAQWAGPGCGAGMQTMLYARRPAGSLTWGAPEVLGAGSPPGDWSPIAGSNGAGQMVVAWSTADGSNDFEFGAVGTPTTGFEPATKLVTAPLADALYYPAVAIGLNGDAAVQWQHTVGSYGNIEVSLHPRGGTFATTPTPLTTFANPNGASIGSIAVDAAGDVLSAYSVYNGTSMTSSFATRFRPATNNVWQPPQALVAPASPFSPSWVSVGLDGNGNGTAVWSETNSTGSDPHPRRLWAAVRPAGVTSPWANPATALSEVVPADYSLPMVAVAPSGAAAISWQTTTPTDGIQALYRPAGGAFGPLTGIGDGVGASVAISSSGDAAIGFYGAAKDARVSAFDATAPVISSVGIPATGTAGTAIGMTAQAGDAWSALAAGQPVWDFGDGVTASGVAVSHVYPRTGTYSVTVSATDTAGLAATPIVRQVTVAATVVPPPPPLPGTTVKKPKIHASYVASKLVGAMTLSGTAGVNAALTISIAKHGAKKAVATARFTVKAGAWTHSIKLPTGLLPATYDVNVAGPGVRGSQTSFTLIAPASGIVKRTFASGPHRGPAITTIGRPNELWAHFAFGTLPKRRQTITTQWILPNGSKLAANARPRSTLVEAQVTDLSGKPLPAGRWHCVLRAGGVVVATLNVRVR